MKITINLNFHVDLNGSGEPFQLPENKQLICDDFATKTAEAISQLATQQSPKTTENYKTALRAFLAFDNESGCSSQLTPACIAAFGQWLRQKGICPNTLSCYMRSLRAIVKQIADDPAAVDGLFRHVFTGNARTAKRAVDEVVVARMAALRLVPGSYTAFARDLFLFSFYAQGMPFVDMARLQRSQLTDGHIVYYRHKTGQRVAVRLEPCMKAIISRYADKRSAHLFPIIACDETDRRRAQQHYDRELHRYNRALKRLAGRAGISQNITSYVARHSWASMAYSHSVDLAAIAKALGHTNPQTTLTYVRELCDRQIDEANHRLLADFEAKVADCVGTQNNKNAEKIPKHLKKAHEK